MCCVKCGMTEEKAKEILDFLARKIGFDRFVIEFDIEEYLDDRECYVAGCMKNGYSIGIDLMQVESNGGWDLVRMSSLSYVKMLENLLEMSRIGGRFICESREFLPANTFLESILIEMDLKYGLK